jgi:hypothetical protein
MGIKTLNYAFAQQDFEKPSYLASNSQSLQKPIEGVYPYWRFSQSKTAVAKLNFVLYIRGL